MACAPPVTFASSRARPAGCICSPSIAPTSSRCPRPPPGRTLRAPATLPSASCSRRCSRIPFPIHPRPRLFRLGEDRAVINRMGLPGQGLDAALSRLKRRPRNGFVGVNVGANKDSTDRAADYVVCGSALAPYADYLVCNVSSPNTPGLRNLQGRAQLADLLKRVKDAIAVKPVPRVVKIAPDPTDEDLYDIVAVCRQLRIDGIIVGNTTLARPPSLRSAKRQETAGLSGTPLAPLSAEVPPRTAR